MERERRSAVSFPGTEHYREKPKKFGVENPFVGFPQYQQDILALCDYIEDLQKQNEQAWERAALEARRVLKNGSKARKLERQVEEQDKEIERLREVLVHADADLSLIRHRGFVEWGKGIPEAWEIDQTIGKIRRASEGKL